MKLSVNKQLLLRMITVIAESVLFYIGFLFVNNIVGGSRVSIIFFILTALCGLLVNLLPYNNSDKQKNNHIEGYIGLAAAVLSIGISSIWSFNVFTLPISFIALVFLYYRSYISYLSNILYIYTAGSFYQCTLLLFIINAFAAFWSSRFGVIAAEIIRYTVLYIIMSVYILSEVKNFKYVSKNEDNRRTSFDIIATSLMIIITVVMSVPRVFKFVTFPFTVAFKFIYSLVAKGVLLITYPVAWVINYIYDLIERPTPEGFVKPGSNDILEKPDQYKEYWDSIDSPLIELIGKALTFVIMLVICGIAIYFLFRLINRITRKDEELDFVEHKEFLIKSSMQRTPGLLNRLAGSVRRAAKDFSFMLTADNRDKLRNEYKTFVYKLSATKVIEGCDYTAQEILHILLAKMPERQDEITSITDIYEEVRYGNKYPEDNELKNFRRSIMEISKNQDFSKG